MDFNKYNHKPLTVLEKVLSYIGIDIKPNLLYETETVAPTAFTYSLFYVYYD